MANNNYDCAFAFYILFLATYIIGFYCIYIKNLEFIGLGLLYVITIFASIFCASNLLNILTPMPIFAILCIIFIFNIVAFTLMMVTISRVYKYSTRKGSDDIILSPNNKKMIKRFKDLFVSSAVFIWTFLIVFYFDRKNKEQPYAYIDINLFNAKSSIHVIIFEIFKTILLAYPFAVSIYQIVLSNRLAMLTRSLL